MRIALNFHAWGPLFIEPYNWDGDVNNSHVPPLAAAFYDEVVDHAGVPAGYIAGNGRQTIAYTANGEASDWMLHERNIYAVSPELGIKGRAAEHFFISDKLVLEKLLV